jgi:hypothetical protein
MRFLPCYTERLSFWNMKFGVISLLASSGCVRPERVQLRSALLAETCPSCPYLIMVAFWAFGNRTTSQVMLTAQEGVQCYISFCTLKDQSPATHYVQTNAFQLLSVIQKDDSHSNDEATLTSPPLYAATSGYGHNGASLTTPFASGRVVPFKNSGTTPFSTQSTRDWSVSLG